jgi:recombination protein RecR
MKVLDRLAACFERLPGVGRKSAERFAYHVLAMPLKDVEDFADGLLAARRDLRACGVCGCFDEADPCAVCSDESRDRSLLCVVDRSGAAALIERTGGYRGLYHVLGGHLHSLPRTGRPQPRVKALLARAEKDPPREIVLALPPSAEGEATAAMLARMLKPLGLRVTRLGVGLPAGSELEYADEVTLARAIEGRTGL